MYLLFKPLYVLFLDKGKTCLFNLVQKYAQTRQTLAILVSHRVYSIWVVYCLEAEVYVLVEADQTFIVIASLVVIFICPWEHKHG